MNTEKKENRRTENDSMAAVWLCRVILICQLQDLAMVRITV